MEYSIGRADYMWVNPTLTASEREHTVVLYPELVISGRVTDAETGHLLPQCRLVPGRWSKGRDKMDWSENDSVELMSGQYRVRIADVGDGARSESRPPVTSQPCRGPFNQMRVRRPSTSR